MSTAAVYQRQCCGVNEAEQKNLCLYPTCNINSALTSTWSYSKLAVRNTSHGVTLAFNFTFNNHSIANNYELFQNSHGIRKQKNSETMISCHWLNHAWYQTTNQQFSVHTHSQHIQPTTVHSSHSVSIRQIFVRQNTIKLWKLHFWQITPKLEAKVMWRHWTLENFICVVHGKIHTRCREPPSMDTNALWRTV